MLGFATLLFSKILLEDTTPNSHSMLVDEAFLIN